MKRIRPNQSLKKRRGVLPSSKQRPNEGLAILLLFVLVPVVLVFIILLEEATVNPDEHIFSELVGWESTGKATKEKPVTIAYAVSLIKCGDHQGSSENLGDGGIILRHSIHQNSRRNPDSGSRYDYKMYAIVHEDAKQCSGALRDAGFEIIIAPPPVKRNEIKGEFLKKNIQKERCCGEDEFVKLYAYKIQAPLVVHLDMDFILTKPMDHLFDAMLDPYDKEARMKIQREVPDTPWPNRIDAMFTKDWPQVIPGRQGAYQAGFIVLKPSIRTFDEVVAVIREGNYTGGFGRDNGWGGLGYGGFVGGMAMQGLMAYYYDQIRPGTFVELNQCRYNHMGMNTRLKGKCRNGQPTCEDCLNTPIENIYSIHYTMCRKPWLCIAEGSKTVGKSKDSLHEDVVKVGHCLDLAHEWHKLRSDLEDELFKLTKDNKIKDGRRGSYKKQYFLGHCKANKEYIGIQGSSSTLKRIPELYK